MQTNIASQFTDLRRLPYRLHSVFIHRGFVNSGHYWIYIYDFKKEVWRKYNDGYVDDVLDTRDIFEESPDAGRPGVNPATSYYLTYVRDDIKGDLVESVCRDIPEPPPQPPGDQQQQQDVEMTDYSGAGGQQQQQQAAYEGNTGEQQPTSVPSIDAKGNWDSAQANIANVRW